MSSKVELVHLQQNEAEDYNNSAIIGDRWRADCWRVDRLLVSGVSCTLSST